MARDRFKISLLAGILFGVLGGALAGWLMTMVYLPPAFDRLAAELKQPPPVVTSTQPQVEVVPVERRPLLPATPSFLNNRSVSPVLMLIKKPAVAKNVEDKIAATNKGLGNVVAVTSDGWLAVPYSFFSSLRLADLAVVWKGSAYPIKQAIRDTATDAVFIKIEARDLPAAAFVRPTDVAAGAAVWLEPRGGRLYPEIISDIRLTSLLDPLISEKAQRRFLISGQGDNTWIGGAVWDGSGQLIGLLESYSVDGWRVLPASDLSGALSSLLTDKEIRHAYLGVRVSDLSGLVLPVDSRDVLPLSGAWLRADRLKGLPALAANSPARSILAEGDVIERVERDILDGSADLGERLLDYKPGANIKLTIRREKQTLEVTVKLGSVVTSEILK